MTVTRLWHLRNVALCSVLVFLGVVQYSCVRLGGTYYWKVDLRYGKNLPPSGVVVLGGLVRAPGGWCRGYWHIEGAGLYMYIVYVVRVGM